ncbi:hypothetical protein BVC80_9057g42 [Macleaya cordata]|uniref:Uncharacterized protein n=1 Tax=Macleaya cordata TaxID=56857 RepID=A0A200R9V9_MACCD|nr:hypothetical protein BVC80_9057g42 [Macleaya cordata]
MKREYQGDKNAVSAMNLVINYVPASSEALQELLSAIHSRLADAVASLIDILAFPILEQLALDELLSGMFCLMSQCHRGMQLKSLFYLGIVLFYITKVI